MIVMYYEYHLENGVIMNSDKPFVDGFHLDCGEQTYCPDLDEWYEVDTFVKVSYCLLKEGNKPLSEEELEDMMDRMSSMD
jgi:hypothetical protein